MVDIDGLPSEYRNFEYGKYAKYRLFSLKQSTAETYVYDISSLLSEAINGQGFRSCDIVCISLNPHVIREMMQYHIGTIQIGKPKKDLLADNLCLNVDELDKFLSFEKASFPAEIYAENISNPLSSLNIRKKATHKGNNYQLFFGGRYFPNSRGYFPYDALSERIRSFKNRKDPNIESFIQKSISVIYKHKPADLITYVPLKPKDIEEQRFDRFGSIELPKIENRQLEFTKILECIKDYSQKGSSSAETKKKNVINAYKVIDKEIVDNKTVLVLDDTHTTGSTANEIADILYEAGAKEVLFLVIGVNQMIDQNNYPFVY